MKNENSSLKAKNDFFGKELVVINVGIKVFYEDLRKQNIKVIHVDWKPPAGGDEEIIALLDRIL